jgi:hypothetical protein
MRSQTGQTSRTGGLQTVLDRRHQLGSGRRRLRRRGRPDRRSRHPRSHPARRHDAELDGPATLRLLQADPRTARIPVIFLTAKVQTADQKRYLALGVAGVISKPFDPLRLPSEVETIMNVYLS